MKVPIWKKKKGHPNAYIYMRCKEDHGDGKVVQVSKGLGELHRMRSQNAQMFSVLLFLMCVDVLPV